jgi:hypothetical protein
VDIQNKLKPPQWVRVQGVFFKKFYPVCVEFYSLAPKRYRYHFTPIINRREIVAYETFLFILNPAILTRLLEKTGGINLENRGNNPFLVKKMTNFSDYGS